MKCPGGYLLTQISSMGGFLGNLIRDAEAPCLPGLELRFLSGESDQPASPSDSAEQAWSIPQTGKECGSPADSWCIHKNMSNSQTLPCLTQSVSYVSNPLPGTKGVLRRVLVSCPPNNARLRLSVLIALQRPAPTQAGSAGMYALWQTTSPEPSEPGVSFETPPGRAGGGCGEAHSGFSASDFSCPLARGH